jgi:hypothetical protein
MYGTIAVHPKGGWRVRSGDVHIHFLEEVQTEGHSYQERNELAQLTWDRMADAFREHYGIDSAAPSERARAAVAE